MVPSRVESFSLDSSFGRFVLFEHVEGDAVDEGKVLGRMACSFSAQVFSEADIEHPVQLVFDAPVLPDRTVQPGRVGLEAGDVEAGFGLRPARCLVMPFGLNAHQAL